jgi:hypothetical protein
MPISNDPEYFAFLDRFVSLHMPTRINWEDETPGLRVVTFQEEANLCVASTDDNPNPPASSTTYSISWTLTIRALPASRESQVPLYEVRVQATTPSATYSVNVYKREYVLRMPYNDPIERIVPNGGGPGVDLVFMGGKRL